MIVSLQTRLCALEQRVQGGGPVVWVRCEHSNETDAPELQQARIDRARADYIAAHGEPAGDIVVIHRVLVSSHSRHEVMQ